MRDLSRLFVLVGLRLGGERSSPAANAPDADPTQGSDPRTQLVRFQIEDIVIPATAGSALTIPLSLDGAPCALHLEAHSLRADGFRVLVQDNRGQIREEVSPITRTYRGEVEGLAGARVAASVADGQLFAVILLESGEK
jgi:hypothetical protein